MSFLYIVQRCFFTFWIKSKCLNRYAWYFIAWSMLRSPAFSAATLFFTLNLQAKPRCAGPGMSFRLSCLHNMTSTWNTLSLPSGFLQNFAPGFKSQFKSLSPGAPMSFIIPVATLAHISKASSILHSDKAKVQDYWVQSLCYDLCILMPKTATKNNRCLVNIVNKWINDKSCEVWIKLFAKLYFKDNLLIWETI